MPGIKPGHSFQIHILDSPADMRGVENLQRLVWPGNETILVNDFSADHDAVFREVADLYAFRENNVVEEGVDKTRIDFIRKFVAASRRTSGRC